MPEEVEQEYSYDPSSEPGKVRLLISDIGGEDHGSWIFKNEEIDAFLQMRDEDVFLAAATALRAMAGNEAMVAKRIKFLELETDGPATAQSLRELAKECDKMSDEAIPFELIEVGVDFFSRREIRLEQFGEYW